MGPLWLIGSFAYLSICLSPFPQGPGLEAPSTHSGLTTMGSGAQTALHHSVGPEPVANFPPQGSGLG